MTQQHLFFENHVVTIENDVPFQQILSADMCLGNVSVDQITTQITQRLP
jgi:hypothetical protein